ncbi:arylsulfotransferase family protein [Stutzerimonas stutzeri]|uniref:arylsulfotransferase family protein n=1 Tax=Stutzerimonas stutzeri TaxID=316 RepID=UPI003C703FAB
MHFPDGQQTAAFAPAKGPPGQVLVSFRNLSTIALVDPALGAVTWATTGPWLVQHDSRLLPNGNMTLFDNAANYREANISRVLEVNPTTREVVWSYEGNDEPPSKATFAALRKHRPTATA